jgi:SAM-dependent methyltransferase
MVDTSALPLAMTAAEVAQAVRNRYSEVAARPDGPYNFSVGRAFAEALGYPSDLLDDLPASVWEAFTGVATPSLAADVQPGDSVVDLGCGAGLDLILLSKKAGPTGHAIGIDFAPGMVERARGNVARLGLAQTEVRQAAAHETGLPEGSIDWVVANGILNLSPDKRAVVREITRILRPGGRFLLAETTLRAPLSPTAVSTIDDWFR